MATEPMKAEPQNTIQTEERTHHEAQPSFTHSVSKPQSNSEQKKRSHTIAECVNLPVTETSNEHNEEPDLHIYDDLDSALSETLFLIQTMANDEDQPIYDDAITPVVQSVNSKHTDVPQSNSTNTSEIMYSDLIPRKASLPICDDTECPVYDDALPPSNNSLTNRQGVVIASAHSQVSPQKKSSQHIRYAEVTAVKNVCQDDDESMIVRRTSTTTTETDDVFHPVTNSSPNPKPLKRTRFLTSTSPPKVSPKPKPRRLTAPLKSEGDEPSKKIEQILATSVQKGEVKANFSADRLSAKTKQSAAETKPIKQSSEPKKPPYVNLEVRARPKKPPPSPPRKHSSLSVSSSPGTVKKSVPPVAPKPRKH